MGRIKRIRPRRGWANDFYNAKEKEIWKTGTDSKKLLGKYVYLFTKSKKN